MAPPFSSISLQDCQKLPQYRAELSENSYDYIVLRCEELAEQGQQQFKSSEIEKEMVDEQDAQLMQNLLTALEEAIWPPGFMGAVQKADYGYRVFGPAFRYLGRYIAENKNPVAADASEMEKIFDQVFKELQKDGLNALWKAVGRFGSLSAGIISSMITLTGAVMDRLIESTLSDSRIGLEVETNFFKDFFEFSATKIAQTIGFVSKNIFKVFEALEGPVGWLLLAVPTITDAVDPCKLGNKMDSAQMMQTISAFQKSFQDNLTPFETAISTSRDNWIGQWPLEVNVAMLPKFSNLRQRESYKKLISQYQYLYMKTMTVNSLGEVMEPNLPLPPNYTQGTNPWTKLPPQSLNTRTKRLKTLTNQNGFLATWIENNRFAALMLVLCVVFFIIIIVIY